MTDWLQTAAATAFEYANPQMMSISLSATAQSLAKQTRYLGHAPALEKHYSIAEHSYHVSYAVPEEHAALGLLHDAHESVTGDWPAPMKRHLRRTYGPMFDEFEHEMASAFLRRFLPRWDGFSGMDEVRTGDLELLRTEADAFVPEETRPRSWNIDSFVPRPKGTIKYWTPSEAYAKFMDRAEELGIQ